MWPLVDFLFLHLKCVFLILHITPRQETPHILCLSSLNPLQIVTILHQLFYSFFVTDGQDNSSAMDADSSVSPVPLQRTKPFSAAPQVPKEPPPRHVLMPRPASRQDRPSDFNAGKMDDTKQKPDSSTAANGESGVYVSRVPSFQSRKPPLKGTSANREGTMSPVSM